MATNKKPFTLRLNPEILTELGRLAHLEDRNMTNYLEHIILDHIRKTRRERGEPEIDFNAHKRYTGND